MTLPLTAWIKLMQSEDWPSPSRAAHKKGYPNWTRIFRVTGTTTWLQAWQLRDGIGTDFMDYQFINSNSPSPSDHWVRHRGRPLSNVIFTNITTSIKRLVDFLKPRTCSQSPISSPAVSIISHLRDKSLQNLISLFYLFRTIKGNWTHVNLPVLFQMPFSCHISIVP